MGHKKHDRYITLIWIVSILVSVGIPSQSTMIEGAYMHGKITSFLEIYR